MNQESNILDGFEDGSPGPISDPPPLPLPLEFVIKETPTQIRKLQIWLKRRGINDATFEFHSGANGYGSEVIMIVEKNKPYTKFKKFD